MGDRPGGSIDGFATRRLRDRFFRMAALIYLLILVAAFFILIVVPQRRQASAHRALVASVDVGDDIMTTSGIFGTITRLDEATAEVRIAPGVVIRIARGAISQRVTAPDAGVDLTGEAGPASGADQAADRHAAPDTD
jgi:preprotein translocase subunit YajC